MSISEAAAMLIAIINLAHGCLPGGDIFQAVLGGNVRIIKEIKMVSTNAPSIIQSAMITVANQLNCTDFDDDCRWRNANGLFVDEMDWFQGTGTPESNRFQQITGTDIAATATSMKQLPAVKALLASDTIPCQDGNGELKFRYWTSPQVAVSLCVKRLSQLFPSFDFCSPPLTNGDPGPAIVSIPGPRNEPFEMFIKADNFIFGQAGLYGGLAIIDDIEYNARLCGHKNSPNGVVPLMPDLVIAGTSSASLPPQLPRRGVNGLLGNGLASSRGASEDGDQFGSRIPLKPTIDEIDDAMPEAKGTATDGADSCDTITCDFGSGRCLQFVRNSQWRLSNGPVGNPLTGIRGDASKLPFNPDGSFAYAQGPIDMARYKVPAFTLPISRNLMFAYYKASKNVGLNVYIKRSGQPEKRVFAAPKLNRDSRRWFREARQLTSGDYDGIIFEAINLSVNEYVGIDDIQLVDLVGAPLC